MKPLPKVMARILDITSVLLAICAVAVMIVNIAFLAPTLPSTASSSIDVPVGIYPTTVTVVTSKTFGDAAIGTMNGNLALKLASRTALWVQLLKITFFVMPILLFLRLLRHVFASIDRGEPFTDSIVRQVNWLGVGIIAFYVAKALMGLAIWMFLKNDISTSGVILAPAGIDPAGMFIGLAVLVLARVFRYGTDLRAETDLTV